MILSLDPNTLVPNPWNPNRVDPINQEKLQTSMEQDGQKLPILVREIDGRYQIIDGYHRAEAAKALGVDVEVKNLGDINDVVAKKATLIANSRYGDNDSAALIALLTSDGFETADELLSTLPIDETELTSLFSTSDADFDDLDMGDDDDLDTGEGGDIDLSSVATPATEKIVRFKLLIDDAEALESRLEEIIDANEIDDKDKLRRTGEALMRLIPAEEIADAQ